MARARKVIFAYGQREIQYLSGRDGRLGAAIARIGMLEREVNADLFDALCSSILAQQVSGKAALTVYNRLQALLGGAITPEAIARMGISAIQSCGMSNRKAGYLMSLAEAVLSGRLDLHALNALPDEAVCATLVDLPGIGVWTAEMLMIFSLQRPNILSYGDFGIQRGLRMLYRKREIGKAQFARYRKRYSPYCSVASLYLWALAGGAIPGLDDPASPKKAPAPGSTKPKA